MHVAIRRHICRRINKGIGAILVLKIEREHKYILRKLYLDRIIGEKHTSIVYLTKGAPPKFQRSIGKAAEDLIRKGFVVKKTTSYGMQVSLNVKMIPEIEQILGISP
jgi:hypothetical protein